MHLNQYQDEIDAIMQTMFIEMSETSFNNNIDVDFYVTRARNDDEIFPWDFIDTGVTKKFLLREWHNAQNEKVTPNCRMQCSGCGAASFGGGICYEN